MESAGHVVIVLHVCYSDAWVTGFKEVVNDSHVLRASVDRFRIVTIIAGSGEFAMRSRHRETPWGTVKSENPFTLGFHTAKREFLESNLTEISL